MTPSELLLILLYHRTLQESAVSNKHMAANLTKWWKTKFLNGYRQFTVVPTDCSDGRPSDTEELLGRHDYSGANEKDVCDEKQQPNQQQNNTKNSASTSEKRQLNFEEFECDLSVEGGVDLSGQERQEFSFTLYDFDGHGKITKDDIAGLVTTIYDTLGSSIKVPHYGSKTIKVKLTVSPDQRKKDVAQDATPAGEETSNNNNNVKCSGSCPGSGGPSPHQGSSNHRVKFKRDLNVTIRESRVPRRTNRRRRCSAGATAPVSEDKYANSCSSSCRSGASENNDDGAADISEDDNDDDLPPTDMPPERELGSQHSTPKASRDSGRAHTRRYQQHASARYRHQHGVYCPGESNTPQLLRQRTKKRSSSLQREELLQIIQANMEKNNLSFQTSRKQCDRGGLGEHRHSHHRHRHKLPQMREDGVAAQVQLHYLANAGEYPSFSQDPRSNCYLDLAGLEPNRTYGKAQQCYYNQECRYDKFLGAVVCASSKHASMGYHHPCRTRGHHRSRSHDLSHTANSFQYHLLDPSHDSHHRPYVENGVPHGYHHARLGHHARSKSHEAEYGGVDQHRIPSYKQERKFPPIVLGHSSSPHHLKHRNREQDQARAMKQVVRWLEQEFSSSLNTTEKLNAKNATPVTTTSTPNRSKSPPLTPSKNTKQSNSQTPGSPKKDETPNSPTASSVERHEHHHVHEHIHHHYHHYQETPVLV